MLLCAERSTLDAICLAFDLAALAIEENAVPHFEGQQSPAAFGRGCVAAPMAFKH